MRMRLILCLFLTLAPWTWALAAGDSSVDVVMSIQVLDIELNPASTDYKNVQLTVGENEVIRSTIKNTGNGNQDYAIRIASTTGSWTPVAGAPGTDEYRISALWHEWNTIFTTNTAQATAEFQANDVVTTSDQASSDTVFFNDSENHSTASVKGYNVPTQEDRNLFLWVQGPASSAGANSTAHLTVTVSATP